MPVADEPRLENLPAVLRAHGGSIDLAIDALLGYSAHGDPREPIASLIRWINEQAAPVLSLGTPSGLDVATGAAGRPCVSATATLTLALPNTGLLRAPHVGLLHLADISIPAAAYRRFGIEVGDVFGEGPIIAISAGSKSGGALGLAPVDT